MVYSLLVCSRVSGSRKERMTIQSILAKHKRAARLRFGHWDSRSVKQQGEKTQTALMPYTPGQRMEGLWGQAAAESAGEVRLPLKGWGTRAD